MDGTTGKPGTPDGAGSHIWLRYATQFPAGERTHTIEIGIPVPLGASEETRERLLREAVAGMDQLASHVENRVAQMQQTLLASGSGSPTKTVGLAPVHKAASAPVPAPTNKVTPAPANAPLSVNKTAPAPPPSMPSSPKVPAPTPPREVAAPDVPESKDVSTLPTRSHQGISMASMPGISGHGSESLKLPEFIQFIKDRLGLTPKQAMEKLNVKTLSGLNYRDAIEQLQQAVGKEEREVDTAEQQSREVDASRAEMKRAMARGDDALADAPTLPVVSAFHPTPSSSIPSSSASDPKVPDIVEIRHAVLREVPPPSGFDEEEIDLDELDVGEEEDALEFLPELTEAERGLAEDVLSRLREARGSSAASPGRLKVLRNVTDSQISDEQLQQLIQGIWNVTVLNKLKNDQVEALISWAKEDDFVGEVEMVLALLQEDSYASSDR